MLNLHLNMLNLFASVIKQASMLVFQVFLIAVFKQFVNLCICARH
jgi:hypothetical protein